MNVTIVVTTGELRHTLKGYWLRGLLDVDFRGCELAFSPDGCTLALAEFGVDTKIHLWDVSTGELRCTIKVPGGDFFSMAFSSDGWTLACGGSNDRTVRLWDVRTGELGYTIKVPGSDIFSMAFSPDGRTLAGGECDNSTVRLWDVAAGELRHTLEGHRGGVYSVKFSYDDQFLACSGGEGSVYLWNMMSVKASPRP